MCVLMLLHIRRQQQQLGMKAAPSSMPSMSMLNANTQVPS